MSELRRGRVRVVAVALLLGSVLLLSCQPAQPLATPKPAEKAAATPTKAAAEKPVRGGTMRVIAGFADPDSLDANVSPYYQLNWLNHDALFQQDQDLNATKEGLAKDWAVSADGKTMTLKLREGIKFHDGTDFDAAAVKFNMERVKDPANKSDFRLDYASVNSVEVVDNLTVRLNLRAPDALLLSAMSAKGGQMVSPAAVKKWGQDFGRHPVGTGPFQFVEWMPGDHITVKRFEGYWKKDQAGNQLPYLDQVIQQIVPDETVAVANVRTGQTDLFRAFPVQMLPTLKSDPNLTYTARRVSIISGINLNTKRPPFDNKALRQAVALAVDRQGIADRLGEGGSVQASVLHPMTWAYDEKVGQFPARDLAKAKAKMAEAGHAGGLQLKMPTGTSGEAQSVAQILKANLAEIGLEVQLEVLSGSALSSRVRAEMNYEIAPDGTGLGLADPGYIFGNNLHSQGGRNYYGPYSHPQVDQILDKARGIYDQKERMALYQEVARIIADEMPFIPLYVVNPINGMSKKVRNFVQYPDNFQRYQQVWLAQ